MREEGDERDRAPPAAISFRNSLRDRREPFSKHVQRDMFFLLLNSLDSRN
jgi:hypothetical protein